IPGANSVPGQFGNTVLSGHSSNDLFDPGDYKFIFAQLEKLQKGDTIFVNYKSTRYTYVVTKTQVVKPTNVKALFGYTNKPYLTLITCTPLGTALNRLLVTAEQISPDPAKARSIDSQNNIPSDSAMPGNAPTVIERLFGIQ
ncbi:sortase, partial [Candidatus Saccharibacteria bacterium]|nr:sortase [Candidatus Saccharibacteria bacterium]